MQDIDSLGFNLELTGFGVEEMASLFDEPLEEKPLPQEQDLKPTFEVAVECKDEADQESVFNMLNEKGYICRILTM